MAASELNTRPRWLEIAEENTGGVIIVQPGARVGEKPPKKPPAKPEPAKLEPEPSAKIVRFPVWPEAVRGIPNGVLRSALFGVIERGRRRYVDNERIASVEGLEIFFIGKQLDQSDLDVWEAVLHLCRYQAMGEKCGFTAYGLLKALGKVISSSNRKGLEAQLTRLHACTVRIKAGRYSYSGHLIHHVYRDEKTKRYVVVLNPELRPLFEGEQFTLLDWEVRHALAGKPLAQWLHGFYASHAEPFPISIEKLRELSGSEAKQAFHFKEKIRKALDAVAAACEAHGQPFAYAFDGDLVRVERTPTRSQRKHLAKRPKKRLPDIHT